MCTDCEETTVIVAGISIDVRHIVQSLGLEIKFETNSEIIMDCPFCADARANLSVNSGTGLYHCWRCGAADRRAAGDLPRLVMSMRSVSRYSALEYLIEHGTYASGKELLRMARKAFRPKTSRLVFEDHSETVNYYFAPKHPYWRERGISQRTAEKFHLGYDHKREHAIIPVFFEGTPIGIIRRANNKWTPWKYKEPRNFPKEYILFGIDQCKGEDIIITEGPIDAMKVHEAGYNAVAALGASFSPQQAQLLVDMGPKKITMMTDEDMGGEVLATKIWETVPLRNIYFTRFPEGRKDPGEMTVDEIWESIVTREHVLTLYMNEDGLRRQTA